MSKKSEDQEILQEISTFIREPKIITLSNGKTLEIKPLSWKKELQLINILGKALSEGISLSQLTEETSLGAIYSTSSFIANLLQIAPEILTEMVVVISELDRETIENELILDDLVEIVYPFLLSILIRLKKVVKEKVLPVVQQVMK